MLPFGVTVPATVPQGSEIPEGLMNNPVFTVKQHIQSALNVTVKYIFLRLYTFLRSVINASCLMPYCCSILQRIHYGRH